MQKHGLCCDTLAYTLICLASMCLLRRIQLSTTGLCTKARQLGLLGEAIAAEQLLAERQTQASHNLTAAASCGSAPDYTTAAATGQEVEVEAATLATAAATMADRCTAAAALLMAAARTGGWTEFASARKQAAFLGLSVLKAEMVLQSRRDAAAKAVSEAVAFCVDSWTLDSAESETKDTEPCAACDFSLDMPCAACTDFRFQSQQQQQRQPTDMGQVQSLSRQHLSQPVPHLFLTGSGRQCSSLCECERVIALIAKALQAVNIPPGNESCSDQPVRQSAGDESTQSQPWSQSLSQSQSQSQSQSRLQSQKPSPQAAWEDCMSALSEFLPQEQSPRVQPSSKQPSPDSNPGVSIPEESHRGIAAALIAARHLGLLQTVRLALQAVQTHLELQVQEEQAVVAEFDLPTAEHAQDSTAAWLVAPAAGQMLWQASQKAKSNSPSLGLNWLEHGHDLAGLKDDAEAGSGLLQQESERVQELVARLQKGGRLCHTLACHTQVMHS